MMKPGGLSFVPCAIHIRGPTIRTALHINPPRLWGAEAFLRFVKPSPVKTRAREE